MSAIVILGHSGSGKTSVGAWVAKYLDMPCIDTDDKVLEHLGKTSIQSVWDEEGEASWRKAETEIIPGLLQEDNVVILGGQTSTPAAVKAAIANMPMIINCVADEKTALTRIAKCEDRLVRDLDEAQVRSERVKEYGQLATHELDTSGQLFPSAVPRIKALLAKHVRLHKRSERSNIMQSEEKKDKKSGINGWPLPLKILGVIAMLVMLMNALNRIFDYVDPI